MGKDNRANCTTEDVIRLLREGHGIKKTIKLCHVGYNHPNVIEAMSIMRKNGEPITKYDKKVPIKHGDLEKMDRSNKKGWVRYMLSNPVYFTSVMGREWSEANVMKEADRQFSAAVCGCCGRVHSFIRCMPDSSLIDNLVFSTRKLYAPKNSLAQA
jgi:hypothetical protein